MRWTALVFVLALTTVSCASARLAGRDVVAVAKAPVREWKSVAVGAAVVGASMLLDDEIARVARNNDSTAMNRFTDSVESFGGGTSDKVIAGFLLYGVAARNERARAVAFDSIMSSLIASKAITPTKLLPLLIKFKCLIFAPFTDSTLEVILCRFPAFR